MSWRGDLVARLLGDPSLSALLGDRIAFFENAPSWGADYPQLVLQEISPGREFTHDGHDGLSGPRVQFDIYAKGAAFEAVEAALLAEMEKPVTEVGATRFHIAFLESAQMLDPVDLGNQRRVQRYSMDFIFYHEAI